MYEGFFIIHVEYFKVLYVYNKYNFSDYSIVKYKY